MTTVHDKRYAEAGAYLTAAMDQRAMGVQRLMVDAAIKYGTLRQYRQGYSAPRSDDQVWPRLRKALGSEVVDQYARLVAQVRVAKPMPEPASPRLVHSLLDRGRVHEAQALLDGGQMLVPAEAIIANRRLARALFDRGEVTDGIDAYLHVAKLQADRDARYDTLGELASRLTGVERYQQAQQLLLTELRADVNAGPLWRRLGIVQWYAHRLADAYASLTTALSHGVPEARVAHARGQVLAELGQHPLALVELSLAMNDPLTEASRGYALSAHAYCRFFIGETEAAAAEFAEAEALTPHNAWHYWRRACCNERAGNLDAARRRFTRSLSEQSPALNEHKRRYATRAIERYNRSA